MVKTVNMTKISLAVAIGFLVGTAMAEVKSISEREAKDWLYYALPLPREAKIAAEQVVAPADIAIEISPNAGDLEKNAKKTLEDFFAEKTGKIPNGNQFAIVMGVLDRDGKVLGREAAGAERLKTLPNNDQAYVIAPVGDNRLIVAALDPKGVFYGARTLRQLLSKTISPDAVAIPIATIVDWPDLADRGLWNGASYRVYRWLSELKLNYAKNYGNAIALDKDGKPTIPQLNSELIADAKRYAFNSAPIITHLNFLARNCPSLYNRYPDLAGTGEEAIQLTPSTIHPCPCASNPLLRTLLAGWLKEYAKAGVGDVSVWTSEYRCYCDCPRCAAEVPDKEARQMVLEARAIAGAWRDVQKAFPNFKTRILGFPLAVRPGCPNAGDWDPEIYARVLPSVMKEIPKEMVIEQVYPRAIFKAGRYVDAIDRFAEDGHRIVCYNLAQSCLSAYFDGPARVQALAVDLPDRKWNGGVSWFSFSENDLPKNEAFASCGVSAVAEWTWNAKGRSLGDFFRAWATISGFAHPENAAEWGMVLSPLDKELSALRRESWDPTRLKKRLKNARDGKDLLGAIYVRVMKENPDMKRLVQLSETFDNPHATARTKELAFIVDELKTLVALERAVAARDNAEIARLKNALVDILNKLRKTRKDISALYGNAIPMPDIDKTFETQKQIVENFAF